MEIEKDLKVKIKITSKDIQGIIREAGIGRAIEIADEFLTYYAAHDNAPLSVKLRMLKMLAKHQATLMSHMDLRK